MRIDLEDKDRIALVRGMFDRVARRYDLLNHMFSLNRDLFWRKAAAGRAKVFRTGLLLDLACGTGDQSIALAEAHPKARILGLDFTHAMLEVARKKIGDRPSIRLVNGDALNLPLPDQCCDGITMAFGIRNIPDKKGALAEMLRVLVPGGRALILELTFPKWPLVVRFYNSYLNRLIPKIGGLVSGQGLAYRYLADSIMDFPAPEEFCDLMAQAGFVRTGFKTFTGGIAALHWGEKAK